MASEYIGGCAADFWSALDEARGKLETFSHRLGQHSADIDAALNDFRAASERLAGETLAAHGKGDNPVARELAVSADRLRQTVGRWYQLIAESKKGRKFMVDHEKYLVVMVFGAVKSGKSTLGNLLAGREWLSAPFDNEYKHRGVTEFATQEKGRDTGDIVRADGRTWFAEGVTDTTGDIQYFTLSGLRWFDSPGTGALSQSGDRRDMEAMVDEYLRYVDMCVFLINSSEPGLVSDMDYMRRLSRDGQESLVVITKSDVVEEDLDENGDIIQAFVAKDDERRKTQEDNMLERLAEQYPELDANRYRAMSVSTLVAQVAVQANDEAKFRSSNIDELMRRIAAKARGEAVALKTVRPKQALGSFIDTLIKGDGDLHGIAALRANLLGVLESIRKVQADMERKARTLQRSIPNKVKQRAMVRLYELSKALEGKSAGKKPSGGGITAGVINDEVRAIADGVIRRDIALAMAEATQTTADLSAAFNYNLGTFEVDDITKQETTIAHSYEQTRMRHREPSGVWEHIRHCFGKEYYEEDTETVTTYEHVDLGTNVTDVVEGMTAELERRVRGAVAEAVASMRDGYFAPQIAYIEQMQRELSALEGKLNECRL